jgi:hypothetical protein
MARFIAFALAAVTASATGGIGACQDGISDNRQSAEIAFQIVVDEVACGLEKPERLVVRDDETWARLWSDVYQPVEPTPERPEVDFSREMLIAVAMGTHRSGGFDISVQRIAVEDGRLMVTVQTSRPPPDAVVGMALTQPLQIVRVERNEKEVVFLDEEGVRESVPEF